MSRFDNNDDMSNALGDITPDANTNGNAGPIKNEEAHALAREKGWVAPEEYNYAAYNAAPAASGQNGAGYESVAGGDWAHSAAKYEWQESYGEVGPENKALEDQLFRADHINRQGMKFDQYVTHHHSSLMTG